MRSVTAALLLVAVTSGGAAASTEAPVVGCAAARPEVTSTETAVEARVLTGCTAGELVVHATFVARAHGSFCTAVSSDLETDPATAPQWIHVRLELACAPGERGLLGSQITVEMSGAQDARVATYGFGDSFTEKNPSARHLWTVDYVAGLCALPVGPDPAVKASSGSAGQGGSRARADHEIYDG